jgi:type IV pilus assembly protein PilX
MIRKNSQQGASLIFALMTVAALSLAAVALVRSVDTGSLVMGNLGFKQDAVYAAENAARDAIVWLVANKENAALQNNITANGYSASGVGIIDPTNSSSEAGRLVIDWEGNGCSNYTSGSFATCMQPSAEATYANNVTARYAIFRLCGTAGDPATVSCAKPLNATARDSGERGEMNYSTGSHLQGNAYAQYYRVVVRAKGGRNTVSYTDTIVHF